MSKRKSRRLGANSVPPDIEAAYKGIEDYVAHSIKKHAGVLVSTATRISDPQEARAKLTAATSSFFKAKFVRRMTEVDEEIKQKEVEANKVEGDLTAAKTRLEQTPAQIPAYHTIYDDENKERPSEVAYADWQTRHKVEFWILSFAILVLSFASLLTAHKNLTGSGVFDDTPLVPWTIAALVPLAGWATKTVYSFIYQAWAERAFIILLVTAMLISVGGWIALYSDIYQGLNPDVTLDGLFEDESWWDQVKNTAFVALSLLTEILVGATLALRITILGQNYSRDYWRTNPEYEALIKRIEALSTRFDQLLEDLRLLKGERDEFAHSLELQINIITFAHDGRRALADTPTL